MLETAVVRVFKRLLHDIAKVNARSDCTPFHLAAKLKLMTNDCVENFLKLKFLPLS